MSIIPVVFKKLCFFLPEETGKSKHDQYKRKSGLSFIFSLFQDFSGGVVGSCFFTVTFGFTPGLISHDDFHFKDSGMIGTLFGNDMVNRG